MPARLTRCLTPVLLMGACFAPAQEAPTFRPQQLREDFQIARKALEEGHSGIYRYTPKTELDRRFEAALKALDHPMDALTFYRLLMPTVAAVRCGHTTPLLSLSQKAALEQARLLPLDVKVLEGRIYVFRDYAQGGALAGTEIRAINGLPAARILDTLLAAAPGDGEIPTGRAQWAGRQFKQLCFTLMGLQGPYEVELRHPLTQKVQVVRLEGQALQALRQASEKQFPQDQRSQRFAEWSFEDGGRIARLKVFNFIDKEEDEDGESLLKKAFEAIRAKGSEVLILDLRDNGGGEDHLGKLLFAHLVDAPFQYYDELVLNRAEFSFAKHATGLPTGLGEGVVKARPDGRLNVLRHPNLGLQEPSTPAFRGRVLVLINGGCFSTTAECLTAIHEHHRATFIGEESGGGYAGNTSGSEALLTLPNTKLRLAIPLMTYYLTVKGHPDLKRGVRPDHPVRPTIADELAGRDPEWELALTLAREPQKDPKRPSAP